MKKLFAVVCTIILTLSFCLSLAVNSASATQIEPALSDADPELEIVTIKFKVCSAVIKQKTSIYNNSSDDKKAIKSLEKGDMLTVLIPVNETKPQWVYAVYNKKLYYLNANTVKSIGVFAADENLKYGIITKTSSIYENSRMTKVGRIQKGFIVIIHSPQWFDKKGYNHTLFGDSGAYINSENLTVLDKSILEIAFYT